MLFSPEFESCIRARPVGTWNKSGVMIRQGDTGGLHEFEAYIRNENSAIIEAECSKLVLDPQPILSYGTVEIDLAASSCESDRLVGTFTAYAAFILMRRYGFPWPNYIFNWMVSEPSSRIQEWRLKLTIEVLVVIYVIVE